MKPRIYNRYLFAFALFVGLMLSASAFSQNYSSQGRIRNIVTKKEMQHVSVHVNHRDNSTSTTMSDSLGIFSIDYQIGDTLILSHIGYLTDQHSLTGNESFIDYEMINDLERHTLESVEIQAYTSHGHPGQMLGGVYRSRNGCLLSNLLYSTQNNTWAASMEYQLSFSHYDRSVYQANTSPQKGYRRFTDKLILYVNANKPNLSNNNIIVYPRLSWVNMIGKNNSKQHLSMSVSASYFWNINSAYNPHTTRSHSPTASMIARYTNNVSPSVTLHTKLSAGYRYNNYDAINYLANSWSSDISLEMAYYLPKQTIKPQIGYYYDVAHRDKGMIAGGDIYLWKLNSKLFKSSDYWYNRMYLDVNFSVGYKWIQHRDQYVYLTIAFVPFRHISARK